MTTITETKTTTNIDNSFFWALAVTPLFGIVQDKVIYRAMVGMRADQIFLVQFFGYSLLALLFCYLDTVNCRVAGYAPKWGAGLLLAPLYMFHRIKVTGSSHLPMLVWFASFVTALAFAP